MADIQVLKALLPDNPLCGISTYKDTLNLATGACIRQIHKIVFDGSEVWTETDSSVYMTSTYFPDSPVLGGSPLYCSHFPNNNTGMVNGGVWWFRTFGYTAVASDVTSWKTWLQQQYNNGTPVEAWYVLATPVETTIAVPAGLSGTVEGYLIQNGTPTPTNPIYPTANNVDVWQHSFKKFDGVVWQNATVHKF